MFWWMFVPIYRTSTESDDVTRRWAMVVLIATCGFALSCLVLSVVESSGMLSAQLIRGVFTILSCVSLVCLIYASCRAIIRAVPLWWYGPRGK